MGEYILCEKQDLVGIADAIRAKQNSTQQFSVSELAGQIDDLSKNASVETCTLYIDDSGAGYGMNVIYTGLDANGKITTFKRYSNYEEDASLIFNTPIKCVKNTVFIIGEIGETDYNFEEQDFENIEICSFINTYSLGYAGKGYLSGIIKGDANIYLFSPADAGPESGGTHGGGTND